jgi:hypothetical protein
MAIPVSTKDLLIFVGNSVTVVEKAEYVNNIKVGQKKDPTSGLPLWGVTVELVSPHAVETVSLTIEGAVAPVLSTRTDYVVPETGALIATPYIQDNRQKVAYRLFGTLVKKDDVKVEVPSIIKSFPIKD